MPPSHATIHAIVEAHIRRLALSVQICPHDWRARLNAQVAFGRTQGRLTADLCALVAAADQPFLPFPEMSP